MPRFRNDTPRASRRAPVSNEQLRSRKAMAKGIRTDWWERWHWPSHLKRFIEV